MIEVARNTDCSFVEEDSEPPVLQKTNIKETKSQKSKQSSVKPDSISLLYEGLEDATEPKIQP